MPFQGVRVKGLRELNVAFARYGREEKKALRVALTEAAQPVRERAQELAEQDITNIGEWSEMRIGVTTKVVYVAPKHRQTRNPSLSRPNLAPLLMERAMNPALEETEPEVVELLDAMLGTLGQQWER